MKSTIIQTKIDTNKLTSDIKTFENANNEDAYLFMSKETAETLYRATAVILDSEFPLRAGYASSLSEPHCVEGSFKGRNIYIDNKIPFGDVDIR